MTRATDLDPRFGAALALSLVLHLGAMMLSPSAAKAPAFNPPLPLSVQLMQEPATPVAELARSARPVVRKAAPVRRPAAKPEAAVPAVEPAPQAMRSVETLQTAPTPDEVPVSAPEPVVLLAPVPAPTVPSAEALARYAKSLSQVFSRYKEYPRIAELRGWEGSVTMRLRVGSSGRLIAAELYESSGYEALDKQAMTIVTRAGVLPVPPEGLDAAGVPVLVPINFRLER
ncbi:MAG: energy transducer TonB [Burkholderiales bacterium]